MSKLFNLNLYLKELGKTNKQSFKLCSKACRRNEIIKTTAEKNKIVTKKKKIGEINETKSSFFEKINKSDKLPIRLIIKKTEKGLKIRNKGEEITTPQIQQIIREHYVSKLDNLEEMDQFLIT